MQTFWTAKRVERLVTLWGEGQSGSVIAGKLGTTRNAIMGKVNRLELPERTTRIRVWNGVRYKVAA